ncbi:ABC transporter substrate-binding protein [Phycicoccus endophyticus]|uniref:ABC transporter substrate-binding protein n=1 Tax=Phycicoccus endophyticus TaxID=1690220 RepID=A0A7G9QZQ8_9MICO|nr:ABC transporter substrate-binding protein [Phycicoccus endophyticus]NHI20027.1 ABC transporter substrate-binding protein [Phycicoccus endophyticus]QNN48833.1 ABC transporter substrate-binding protein [Phycicoccus endophyticus]GGL42496.1 hypothetical protein GCM10012283_26370 [Phycicoccus endophyticus]
MKDSTRRRGPLAAAVGVCLLLGALAGCAGETSTDSESGGTIRGALITDPTTFDPALVKAMDDYRAARLGFDTVLRRDDGSTLVGDLAESYTQNDSGVTLQIRDGLTCGDGSELTPSDIAASLQRLADPDTASKAAQLIFGGSAVTVTADDDARTVTVTTAKPYSELAVGLTHPAAGIVCPAGLEDLDGLAAGTVKGAFSGPYVLSSSTTGVGYEFDLRSDYSSWPEYAEPLEGTPAQTLKFTVGATDSAANQLLTGSLDESAVAYQDLSRFPEDSFTKTEAVIGDMFVIFNETAGRPFADAAARKAAAQAIDRSALIDAINPGATPDLGPGDPGLECVNTDASLLTEPDADAAAKVLSGLKIQVVGSTAPAFGTNGAATTYIAEELRAAGATVKLTNSDNATWIGTLITDDGWDISVLATINTGGTLVTGLSDVVGAGLEDGGRNFTRSDNPTATAAFERGIAATTTSEKCAGFQEAQAAALEAVDFIPLATNPQTIVTTKGVTVRAPGGREDLSTLRTVG